MKKFFQKHELSISISLIIIYVISNSFCIQTFGIADYRHAAWNFILSLMIIIFILKNGFGEYYGLTKLPKFKEFLYFIPLLVIITANLWTGININNSFTEIFFYILSMIGVGFLEEIIFRGFLFKAMEKDNINAAIIVTSITFGIGHIINLFNGADLIPTLIQICCAISLGFLFVTIFQKSKSLWPCIIAHAVANALSIFSIENNVTLFIVPMFWIISSISYTIFIKRTIK